MQDFTAVDGKQLLSLRFSLLFPSTPPAPPPPPSPGPQEWGGRVAVINGIAWPALQFRPRPYRLRLLAASTSRFFSVVPQSDSATCQRALKARAATTTTMRDLQQHASTLRGVVCKFPAARVSSALHARSGFASLHAHLRLFLAALGRWVGLGYVSDQPRVPLEQRRPPHWYG